MSWQDHADTWEELQEKYTCEDCEWHYGADGCECTNGPCGDFWLREDEKGGAENE